MFIGARPFCRTDDRLTVIQILSLTSPVVFKLRSSSFIVQKRPQTTKLIFYSLKLKIVNPTVLKQVHKNIMDQNFDLGLGFQAMGPKSPKIEIGVPHFLSYNCMVPQFYSPCHAPKSLLDQNFNFGSYFGSIGCPKSGPPLFPLTIYQS